MLFLIRRRLLTEKARLGRWGERCCERYLRNKGLRTLARNYSCKVGELDLVMVDADRTLVFVEVRSRADERFGPAEATVTPAKRARVARAARHFLAVHKIEDRPLRFDVVTLILGRHGPPQIRHYENAFVP
ncbi:MAG TPA: YraN family protein [Sedimentisphaerales bacterium]|nr:YraN family protein [Phycisphaerae bacterium]HON90139.1 YraN family protein [Sedimentisphaerales bacterium]HOV77770.1 YraN family protein [Sedimentisphaerales bacterium]